MNNILLGVVAVNIYITIFQNYELQTDTLILLILQSFDIHIYA